MKAILVIDVEEDMMGEVDYTVLTKRDMCNGRAKLKPMPKRKLAVFDPNHCDMEEEIKIIREIDGYNRCIDEILGD